MRYSVMTRCRHRWAISVAILALATTCTAALPRVSHAGDEPQPDPSGLATGNRASVVDAGGGCVRGG
jgi:hypothetical protein